MNEKERESWGKKRKAGAFPYIVKNSLLSLVIAVAIFIGANGYRNEAGFMEFLERNFVDGIAFNSMIIGIAFAGMVIVSIFTWNINEKRYKQASKK